MYGITAEVVRVYASLFVGCWDSYAVQQRDGSYRPSWLPLTLEHIASHLSGRYTLGTYVLDRQNCCSFAVLDDDQPDGLERLAALSREFAEVEVWTLLEAGRRGGHLWVFFDGLTAASLVRMWLLPVARRLGVELYPKQETLQAGGPGSLIRLPLGVHRKSGGWYPFVQMADDGRLVPVGETVADCILWVASQVQRVQVPDAVPAVRVPVVSESGRDERERHGDTWAAPRTRERRGIRAWCASQDIVGVIGRSVALDRRGVGSCPFKEHHARGDVHPSFQVFGGMDPHWYCYTWQRAGNLFDFLCLYHQLSAQETWAQIRAGRLP